tara:strand:- start:342 stop:1424 length:1083 start_codon:yes stop_codon:yes gene_type:complete
MRYLVTGGAGFIGFHVIESLLKEGHEVASLDNINEYYDQQLKFARLEHLFQDKDYSAKKIENIALQNNQSYDPMFSRDNFSFYKIHLENKSALDRLFKKESFDIVIHLAAQAGVRYSITNPETYIQSNLKGFSNIIETSVQNEVKHFVYASSSSVYGSNTKMPFSEKDPVDHPLSLYAATKKSNEMLAHAYSNIHNLPCTGLRFFTVYGPWGRPDMSLFLFTKSILEGKPIDIFNNGNHKRDFTYIDDIVDGVIRTTNKIPGLSEKWNSHTPSFHDSDKPWRVFNIANGTPVPLMEFIETIEAKLKKKAVSNLLPLQPGDVPETHADISLLSEVTGYLPKTSVKEGVSKFVDWYLSFYGE